MPCEAYCHSLTDPTILSPELAASGAHTLTVFGLQVPGGVAPEQADAWRRRLESAVLAWPFLDDGAPRDTRPAGGAWPPAIPAFCCALAGAVRGGGVSGIGGHNAAIAVLAGA